MNGSGKAGNGRGNNRKRSFNRRNNKAWKAEDTSDSALGDSAFGASAQNKRGDRHRGGRAGKAGDNYRGERVPQKERPKWTPPKVNSAPLPVPDCSWCGKPIRDISQAISDRESGKPIHFDCVTSKIAKTERLEKGDTITYIGGGRFGIVNLSDSGNASRSLSGTSSRNSPSEFRDKNNNFRIKKVIEWEDKENRAQWRYEISNHYSVT